MRVLRLRPITNGMSKKNLTGKVVSNKMAKTLVVRVSRLKVHPKYKKRISSSKRYKVHYTEGTYEIGQKVVIEETRPISRHKRWKVISAPLEKNITDEATVVEQQVSEVDTPNT